MIFYFEIFQTYITLIKNIRCYELRPVYLLVSVAWLLNHIPGANPTSEQLRHCRQVEPPPVQDDPIVTPWCPSGYSGYLGYRSRRLPLIMRPKLQKQSALKLVGRNETKTLKAKRIKVC